MTAAILEIRDGVAVGPLHQPAPRRPIEGRGGFRFSALETPPLEWVSLCGATGYVYQRDGLELLGHTSECFDCAIIALTPKRKPRLRRVTPPSPPIPEPVVPKVCAGCGKPVSRNTAKWCSVCYHGQRPKAGCGTRSRYVLGCRCELCTQAEADYAREYKRAQAAKRLSRVNPKKRAA